MASETDLRQRIQDFVAPDLPAIRAQLDAVETRLGVLEEKLDASGEKWEAKLGIITSLLRTFERADLSSDDCPVRK